MKIKEILNIKKCPRLAYWSKLNLDSAKGFGFKAATAFKSIVQEMDFTEMSDYWGVRDRLEELIDEEFQMETSQEINFDLLTNQINRMAKFFIENHFYKVAGESEFGSYKPNGFEEIKVVRDLILEDDQGIIYSVKLSTGKASYGKTSRSKENVNNDVQSFIISQAFPNTVPAYFFLKGKGETNDDFLDTSSIVDLYCENWFVANNIQLNSAKLEAELLDLLNTNTGKDSQCNYENCRNCFYKSLCRYDDIDNKLQPLETVTVKPKSHLWTPAQTSVINFTTGEARVIAGAGSGKTSTLVNRMIKLTELVHPSKILAITFTEKGVEEIHKKLKEYLDMNNSNYHSEDFQVYTFNGFGYDFVRNHYKECGFTESPKLIEEDVKTEIVAKILDTHKKIGGLNYVNPFMDMFNAKGAVLFFKDIINILKKRNAKTPMEICNALEMTEETKYLKLAFTNIKDNIYDLQKANLIKECYDEYNQYLLSHNLVEYQDQINIMLDVLNKNHELHELYFNKYNHIIIDEFQDTGNEQMMLIKNHLYQPSEKNSLMVCGDDAQSIFGFIDVDATNILTIEKYYPNIVDLKILENFRSTQEILDIANDIIGFNKTAIKKHLFSSKRGCKPIIDAGDIPTVVDDVKKIIDSGVDVKDIAILVRTRQECVDLHYHLNKHNINNVVVVSNNVKDDNQVQGMIALAKFLDPSNTEEQRLMEGAVWLRKSDNENFESQFIQENYIINRTNEILTEFALINDDAAQYKWFIEEVLRVFGNNPSPSLTAILSKEEENLEKTFSRLCKYLMMIDSCNTGLTVRSDERSFDAVTISTIHAAKGKEWKYVYCLFNKLSAPKVANNKDTGDYWYEYDPEEVRLAFVGVTRAKEFLKVYATEPWQLVCHGDHYVWNKKK